MIALLTPGIAHRIRSGFHRKFLKFSLDFQGYAFSVIHLSVFSTRMYRNAFVKSSVSYQIILANFVQKLLQKFMEVPYIYFYFFAIFFIIQEFLQKLISMGP